jgi:hypothetical protein
MSDLFQVIITVPANKLGELLSALPPKVQPQINRLVERESKPRGPYKARGPNGEYQPASGTTGEALLKYLQKAGPKFPIEMKVALKNKHHAQAVSSALGRLINFKLVKQNPDGRYGVIK